MKTFLALVIFLSAQCFAASAFNGDSTFTVADISDYETKKISSDFHLFIKGDLNYKKLRDYLVKKKTTLGLLQVRAEDLKYSYKDTLYSTSLITGYKNALIRNTRKDSVILYDYGQPRSYSIAQVNEMIESINMELSQVRKLNQGVEQKFSFVKENIIIIESDIAGCEDIIDEYLTPERYDQAFKQSISIIFSAIVALLLVTFFAFLWTKSESSIARELLSGSGLQFITLFILIIAIILFGILGILESRELAAMLSGIAGYILGKGISSAKKEA